MNRQRVLLFSAFYEPYVSGAERFVQETVARLGTSYEFVLITACLTRTLPKKEVRPFGMIIRVGFGTKWDKFLYPILAPIVACRYPGTLAHAVMESYAGIALAFFGILRPRTIRLLTVQSGDLDAEKKQAHIPRWLWRWIHRSPDHVTAISTFLRDRVVQLRGSHQEVTIVPNGVSLSDTSLTDTRHAHEIVCVARLAWEKGHDTLLAAFALVKQQVPDAHLTLVGDGSLRSVLQTQAVALSIVNDVSFLGALPNEEARQVVARAEVFACPSRAEGLGIVFLEAQAAGTPVIGTNVGGIPDVIQDEKTGLLVPADNAEALAKAILRFFADASLRSSCAAAGAESVKQFRWERVMDELHTLYARLLTTRRVAWCTGIYPPAIGGPATYSATLLPELASRGWLAQVVTYGESDVKPHARLRVVSTRYPIGVKHLLYFFSVLRVARGASVVFVLDPVSSGFPVACASFFVHRPCVLRMVGQYAWEQGQARFGVTDMLDEFQTKKYGMQVELLRHIEQWVAHRMTHIITPSKYLAGIIAQWGIPKEKISVVNNAVAVTAHSPRTAEQHRTLAPTLLTAARLLPWKGCRELVRALPVIREKVPGTTLTILGDGPERKNIEAEIARLGLSDAVFLLGRLPYQQAAQNVQNTKVFLLYTAYEGFSHQLVETMALGVPIVSSAAGGSAEVVHDGGNALVVNFGDEPALISACVRLLTDDTLAARCSAQAVQDATQYTVARTRDGLLSVLASVCQ